MRLLGLALALGAVLGEEDALGGSPDFDVMLLGDSRVFAVALDVERPALGLQILRPDFDLGSLLDLVAHPPSRFDGFRELGEALGVERVRAVEELEPGLVEVNDGDAFELQAVLRQSLGGGRLDPLGVVLTLFVQALERHLCGGGAERRCEPAFKQLSRTFGVEGPATEGLRRAAHLLAGRADANEEIGDDVDAHPILGDEALCLSSRHLDAHHVHADRSQLVQDGNDESAAADHHLLPAEPGSDKGGLLGRTPVEPAQQVDGDHHDDRQNDQP